MSLLAHLRQLDAQALTATSPFGRVLRRGAAALLTALAGAGAGFFAGIPISILVFEGSPQSLGLLFVCPAAGACLALSILRMPWRRQ